MAERYRVLVADDEAPIRAVVAAVLGAELPARVDEAADAALAEGCAAVLTKPFDLDELLGVVRGHLDAAA